MALPCVSDVHGYLPNPKVSQDYKILYFGQGLNHELISIDQIQPFGDPERAYSVEKTLFQCSF